MIFAFKLLTRRVRAIGRTGQQKRVLLVRIHKLTKGIRNIRYTEKENSIFLQLLAHSIDRLNECLING